MVWLNADHVAYDKWRSSKRRDTIFGMHVKQLIMEISLCCVKHVSEVSQCPQRSPRELTEPIYVVYALEHEDEAYELQFI